MIFGLNGVIYFTVLKMERTRYLNFLPLKLSKRAREREAELKIDEDFASKTSVSRH